MGLVNTRRGFLTLLGGLVAAPAIVRASSLMPVRAMLETPPLIHAVVPDGAVLAIEYKDIVRKAFLPRLFGAIVRRLADDAGTAATAR